jgi:hypothetical protein
MELATDPQTGQQTRFLSRLEAKRELHISEATFHKYVSILVDIWGERFRYIPRQTHWSEYQIHCLTFVKYLFETGRNEAEVKGYIAQYRIPDTVPTLQNSLSSNEHETDSLS